jgi:hypothetical protein
LPLPSLVLDIVINKQNNNSDSDNNSIKFFIYLRAELNSQWRITETAPIQTTAIRKHGTKQTRKKQQQNKKKLIS